MSLVRFNANGEAVFIYEDGHPCLKLGRAETKRASHVEPTEDGMWQADMGPVGGPRLSKSISRSTSLKLENEWMTENLLMQLSEDYQN